MQEPDDLPIDQRSIGSCVNSALPPKVKTMSFRAIVFNRKQCALFSAENNCAELTHEACADMFSPWKY
ncbi:MAG: hypothetical protein Q7S22_03770 [Candidatus Micrarchaeota archaeon]|nr:hypothetical protein [Candidatus Micrarchaeota archaeon]